MNAQTVPLCLGLAGTLTPSDVRLEHLLGAIKHTAVDPRTLPIRDNLLKWLREERATGRRVVLLADQDPALAEQVAAHLGVFDEIASLGDTGTAVERRRRALVDRFGERGFDFAGSNAEDLPVWAASRGAVIVGDQELGQRVSRTTPILQVFSTPKPGLRTWIKAIRLHQWVKNALVLLPALLAHRINDPAVLFNAALAFIAFGCCASSVYIINDLFDLAADRLHPRKRHRPFAAALLSVRSGVWASLLLMSCAALLAAYIGPLYAAVLACYFAVTWAYSLRLKRVALVDVMTLAGLYTLRIIAGANATGIELSFWLLAFSVFLFLSLGFVKRYAEIDDGRKSGKIVGHSRGYGADDLPVIMSLGTASGYCAVVVIALYINSVDSLALYKHHKTLWLVCPLMLFWISRVWVLTSRGHMHDDPVVFALRDRMSLVVVAALGLIVLLSV